jgi:hypothetical protein
LLQLFGAVLGGRERWRGGRRGRHQDAQQRGDDEYEPGGAVAVHLIGSLGSFKDLPVLVGLLGLCLETREASDALSPRRSLPLH